MGGSSDWLGEPLTVRTDGSTSFLGVVTNVHMHREDSEFGHLVVSGYSATYRLETAPGNFSWTGKKIGEIVSQLCDAAGVGAKVNAAYDGTPDYLCQYGESQFDFIRRLSAQYKEWLYYDGTSLVFGNPKTLPDSVCLEFGTTLSSLDIGIQTLARPKKAYSYHSSSDQQMNEASPSETAGQDLLARKAVAASMKLFSVPARQYAEQRVNSGPELVDYMRRKQSAETAESHYVTAESRVPGLCVGSVVKIDSSFYQSFRSLSRRTLGEFIITEIVHEVGEDGYYRNRFKALPSALEVIPVPDVRIPHAETQMATVTRNDDPRGSGRIQVRMNWQADDMNTNWIRVMTPDGGSSSDVKSNRGFVFIPEVGDHVLVGFRHGDPSRPYAMGSLFNGSTGGGGGKGNNCKSLTTRSGSTLKLDDSTGNVLLADKTGQNLITFDGNNTVTVSSATNIHLDNGKASIKMEGDVITIKANTICIDGATSTTCQSGESDSVVITSGTGVDIKGVDINAIAETNAEISGGSKSVLSSPSTSISGDADVTINGGLVKINS
ncbi:type VI secretion system Vgr family protein [Prevotella fusca]|nr:phage baseplate assembly protein V [Prevotella fusca]